jgi:hypothetical protein
MYLKLPRAITRACAIAAFLVVSVGPVNAANIVIDNFITSFDVTGETGWNLTNGDTVGPKSGVTTLSQTGVTGAIGDRTTTFTGDQPGNGAVTIAGFTIDANGDFVASAGEGVLTLSTNALSTVYGFEIAYAVTDLDLSSGDRFVFNYQGDLDAPRNPVESLPFDIELTSGATSNTAGVMISTDGGYEILFSAFAGIDFSDIDGIRVLSSNNGVDSPDLVFGAIEVQVVPVPAAVWLFGSALGLLGWMRRKAT